MNNKDKADVSCRGMGHCHANPVSASNQKRSALNARGFTLIELIMTCAIIAILAAIAIPMWPRYKNLARTSRAMSEIRTVEAAIAGYYADRGFQPPDLNAVGFGTLLDPWDHPYNYDRTAGSRTYSGNPINGDYDLWSNGADSVTDPSGSVVLSPDDVIRGRDGAFAGLAENYPFH